MHLNVYLYADRKMISDRKPSLALVH